MAEVPLNFGTLGSPLLLCFIGGGVEALPPEEGSLIHQSQLPGSMADHRLHCTAVITSAHAAPAPYDDVASTRACATFSEPVKVEIFQKAKLEDIYII